MQSLKWYSRHPSLPQGYYGFGFIISLYISQIGHTPLVFKLMVALLVMSTHVIYLICTRHVLKQVLSLPLETRSMLESTKHTWNATSLNHYEILDLHWGTRESFWLRVDVEHIWSIYKTFFSRWHPYNDLWRQFCMYQPDQERLHQWRQHHT